MPAMRPHRETIEASEVARRRDRAHRVRLRQQQQLARLINGQARVFGKLLVGSATDRVTDDGEWVAGHAEHPAHQLCRADEILRHHAHGRDALLLRYY